MGEIMTKSKRPAERGGIPFSRRAVFAGLGLILAETASSALPRAAFADDGEVVTDVMALNTLVEDPSPFSLFSLFSARRYDDVVNDHRGWHYDYTSIPYNQRVTNWERGWGGAHITWFRSIYYFSAGTAADNVRVNFFKQIDATLEGGASAMYFGEDVHILVDGVESCLIWIPRNQLHVPNGQMREFGSSCIVQIPTNKRSIHFTSYGTEIPEAPNAEFGGGSAFDFWIDFPGYSLVKLRLVSGALNYKAAPAKNGRYRIRSAEDTSSVLTIAGCYSGTSTQQAKNVQMWGEDATPMFEWLIYSTDGSTYLFTPTAAINMYMNCSGAVVGANAQTFRRDDGGSQMLLEKQPDGTFTIRNKVCGAYLTRVDPSNQGSDVQFLAKRGDLAGQRWWLQQLDEVFIEDSQLAGVNMNMTKGASFKVNWKSGGQAGNFTPTASAASGVGIDNEIDGTSPFGNRLVCDKGDFRLVQTSAPSGYGTLDLGEAGIFAPVVDVETTVNWVNQPSTGGVLGRVPVHFMLVTEDGDVIEVHTAGVEKGSTLTTSNGMFSEALRKAGEKTGAERPDLALDCWYRGEMWFEPDVFEKGKFSSEKVDGSIWLWAQIQQAHIEFYADGKNRSNIVYSKYNITVGNTFEFPKEATDNAIEPYCNLNANFGAAASTGFTGWFTDPELTKPVTSILLEKPQTYKVYGRNRCTLRCSYAADSLMPDPAAVYRTAPSDSAPVYSRALMLPTFANVDKHALDGVTLPAIGDDGEGHRAMYHGESCTLAVPAPAYEKTADGTWRTLKAEAWLTSGAAKASEGATVSKRSRSAAARGGVIMERDTERFIRWYEAIEDGVVSRA